MRFNVLRTRGGLVRKHVPTKLDWNLVDKRNLTDGPPPPPTPKDSAALDPNAPPPKDPAAVDPEDPTAPPSPGGGSKKPKGPPGNGTEPVQPNGNPPPTPGNGPKKEKTPPPNPTASAPLPPPTSGAPPNPPLPSESTSLGAVPTSLPPPPPTPKTPIPNPTGVLPPGPPGLPGPKGSKPPPPPPMSQSTLSTSIIAATAAPESLPATTGGGINSNTGTSNGAVVNTNVTTSQSNRAQSQATIAVSVVVIIVGSVALIVGFIFLLRRIMRRRRLGIRNEEYPAPSPPVPPMQSYPPPKTDGEYLPPFNRSISYPVEHYTEAYAPVIMEGRDFNIRRKTVGLGGQGVGEYEEKALSNMPASVMSEAILQDRNSMANAYPRDVKVPPVQMPRDI